MTQFQLSTPRHTHDADPVVLNLCGEEMTLHRPKSMALLNGEQALSPMLESEYPDTHEQVRANLILNFLIGVFRMHGFLRFMERSLDAADPLNVDSIYEAMQALIERWSDYEPNNNPPIVIQPSTEPDVPRQPSRLVIDSRGIDMPAHPPKPLLLMLVSALGMSSELRGQKVATDRLLDGILHEDDADTIKYRLNLPDDVDPLDLDDLDEPINALISEWFPSDDDPGVPPPPGSRAERRAAARHSSPEPPDFPQNQAGGPTLPPR